VLFGWVEVRTRYPVLDVRLLRDNRLFALSNLAALLNYAGTFGVTFFLSLYLQYVKGLSPQGAGAVLFVQPLAQAVLSPLCGRLADRYPPERVATAGMALCTVGLAVSTTITASTSLAVLVVMLAVLGTGFALFSSPNTSAIMGSVPARYYGLASGMVSSMRTLGMLTSMTIITVIFSVTMGKHAVTPETQPAFLLSMRTGLAAFCLLCAAGILFSLGRFRPAGRPEVGTEPNRP
jgi:MFS family permease